MSNRKLESWEWETIQGIIWWGLAIIGASVIISLATVKGCETHRHYQEQETDRFKACLAQNPPSVVDCSSIHRR